MAVVPTYDNRTVEARPINQQGLTTEASAEAFGASAGRGLQQLGAGINEVAQAVQQVNTLKADAAAKQADIAAANAQRELDYGPDGFFMKQGEAAMNGRADYEKKSQQIWDQAGQKLTGEAAVKYAERKNARLQAQFEQGAVHSMRETKTYLGETSAAHVQSMKEDALAKYNDPKAIQSTIAGINREVEEQGRLQGWGAEVREMKKQEQASSLHRAVTLRLAQDDPLAAEKYMNSSDMLESDKMAIAPAIKDAADSAAVLKSVDSLFAGDDMISEVVRAGDGLSHVPGGDGVARANDKLDPPAASSNRARDVAVVAPGRTVATAGIDRVKQHLTKISAHGSHSIDGMDASFATNLSALIEDAPPEIQKGLGITSGYRSREEQIRIFEGSAKNGHRVAYPSGYKKPDGTIAAGSNHEHGNAADLGWHGGLMQYDKDKKGNIIRNEKSRAIDWVHQNAAKYGLYFRMGYEPWHIEPKDKSGSGGATVEASAGRPYGRTTMPSAGEIQARIEAEPDPKRRALMYSEVSRRVELQNKVVESNRKAAQESVWGALDQDVPPEQIPAEMWDAAGGMRFRKEALETLAAVAKSGQPVDDEKMVYELMKEYANDPQNFAARDLYSLKSKLSDVTFKSLAEKQISVLGDQRKQREEEPNLKLFFETADRQIKGMGLDGGKFTEKTDPTGEKKMEQERRLAALQNAALQDIEKFRKQNNGKQPNTLEMQQILNEKLLPMVWRDVVDDPGIDQGDIKGKFAFEANQMPDGYKAEFAVTYDQIEPAKRQAIVNLLAAKTGVKPTAEDVEKYYNMVLTSKYLEQSANQ